MATTEERLAQIRARLEAATPGPWECAGFDGITAAGETIIQAFDAYQNDYPNGAANEEFIAHAREDVPYLLAALADAEARAALLTAALYDEVRHPINVKGGWWTDEEIRDYLSARWGLRIPPEAEPTSPAAGHKED